MSTWAVVALIIFVLGMIFGNIMLLKYSAKSKFEKPSEVKSDHHTNELGHTETNKTDNSSKNEH